MGKVFAYTRVSTPQQGKKGVSEAELNLMRYSEIALEIAKQASDDARKDVHPSSFIPEGLENVHLAQLGSIPRFDKSPD